MIEGSDISLEHRYMRLLRFQEAHRAAVTLYEALWGAGEHKEASRLHGIVARVYPHSISLRMAPVNNVEEVVVDCQNHFGLGGVYWGDRLTVTPTINMNECRWIGVVRRDPETPWFASIAHTSMFFHFVDQNDLFDFKLRYYPAGMR